MLRSEKTLHITNGSKDAREYECKLLTNSYKVSSIFSRFPFPFPLNSTYPRQCTVNDSKNELKENAVLPTAATVVTFVELMLKTFVSQI